MDQVEPPQTLAGIRTPGKKPVAWRAQAKLGGWGTRDYFPSEAWGCCGWASSFVPGGENANGRYSTVCSIRARTAWLASEEVLIRRLHNPRELATWIVIGRSRGAGIGSYSLPEFWTFGHLLGKTFLRVNVKFKSCFGQEGLNNYVCSILPGTPKSFAPSVLFRCTRFSDTISGMTIAFEPGSWIHESGEWFMQMCLLGSGCLCFWR